VLLVANHISWLDILVLHAARHCRFVSKSDVRHWPLIGTLATAAGTLYIERASRRDAMRVVHHMAEACVGRGAGHLSGRHDGRRHHPAAISRQPDASSDLGRKVTTWSTSARMPIHSPHGWSWWLGTWAIAHRVVVWPLARRSVYRNSEPRNALRTICACTGAWSSCTMSSARSSTSHSPPG
jgi:hypothetical protein